MTADSTTTGLLVNQAMISAMIAYGIEFLKKTKYFPWITAESAKLNRGLAVAVTGLAAAGIHMTYAGGILTITGLTWWSLAHGLWDWVRSFLVTQVAYDGLIAPNQKPAPAAPAPPVA